MKKIPIWRNTSLENLVVEIDGVVHTEEWKPITGFEGFYEVSNFCRIKSLKRTDCRGQRRPNLIRLQSFDTDGYCTIDLGKDRKSYTKKPHRLGAIEFIPNPDNLPEVNHLDGVKTNNWIRNFEWSTTKNNSDHAELMGLKKTIKGENNYGAVLKKKDVLAIYKSKLSNKQLAEKYNIGTLAVNRIKIGKTWRSVTGASYKQRRPSNISLPTELVLKIFIDNEGDYTFLSDKYKVPNHIIACIKRGQTYSKITGKYHVVKKRK